MAFRGGLGRRLFPPLLIAAALGGALVGCGSASSREATLLVFGASSLEGAMSEYADSFAGAAVQASYAGSDQLAAQIRQGAPADVFASADTEYPAQLHEEGLLERPVTFARNRLVIAVPRDSAVGGIGDLAAPGTALVVGDSSVPVGAYTRAVIDRLPTEQRKRILANVRSEEAEVSSIVAKVEGGAADAGFVYATDVRPVPGLRAVELPAALRPEIAYAVAVVSGSERKHQAERFVAGLIDRPGAEALRRAGFLPPP
jgi:molybdate transport system substrate-binding protein